MRLPRGGSEAVGYRRAVDLARSERHGPDRDRSSGPVGESDR
ncbi:hypothetical protein ABNG03_09290 [Halorubrum sp. RMP-47]